MAKIEYSDEDEGKKVINAHGDEIGRITEVRGHTAHVDPDPGLMDTMRSKLGWGDADSDTYTLEDEDVTEITDDEVHIRQF
jgi:hypothetical protein